jgi:hypothetical protein
VSELNSLQTSDDACEAKSNIFLNALMRRKLKELTKVYTKDVVLSWGPFKFIGPTKIIRWARELYDLFPILDFEEKSSTIHGSVVRKEFIISFVMAAGHVGKLPCVATFEFDNERIQRIGIEVQDGILLFKQEASNIKDW